MDKGNIAVAIFFDLKKAFDFVDHEIFLSNRSQCVVDVLAVYLRDPYWDRFCPLHS